VALILVPPGQYPDKPPAFLLTDTSRGKVSFTRAHAHAAVFVVNCDGVARRQSNPILLGNWAAGAFKLCMHAVLLASSH
jgi:hypothetical protein